MENLDLKPFLGHLSSAVGHLVINAFSTIVSQGEILRILNESPVQQPREVAERIETLIRTALEASLITRRLIEPQPRLDVGRCRSARKPRGGDPP